jgi:hypothetical protein
MKASSFFTVSTKEAKYDGWRIVAYKDGDRVRPVSRNGRDHTAPFPDIPALWPSCGMPNCSPTSPKEEQSYTIAGQAWRAQYGGKTVVSWR